jgi:hypothetical protein
MLCKELATFYPVLDSTRVDVLASMNCHQDHWRKVLSTNPLAAYQGNPTPHQRGVHLPQYGLIVRLVGIQLLEQKVSSNLCSWWQVTSRKVPQRLQAS